MAQDILNTQLSAEKASSTNSGEKLVEIEEIKDTPFRIVNQGNGYFLTMGSYKLTEETEDKKKLEKIVKTKDWEFLTNVISVIVNEVITEINKK